MSDLLDQVDLPIGGRWGIGVSGGADSVALLRLASSQIPTGQLHVIHLNHETRNSESQADASFVKALADNLRIPSTIEQLSGLQSSKQEIVLNDSDRYRLARLHLFRQVVQNEGLAGVLLAHHADDQAETVFLRLVRGAGYRGLTGMDSKTRVEGVLIHRPLLKLSAMQLRDYLRDCGQPWREDSSNSTGKYARNRVRRVLATRPALTYALLELARQCRALRDWVDRAMARLPNQFPTRTLADLPTILAESSAGEWLSRQGVGMDDVSPAQIQALIDLCRDAATPARFTAPGSRVIRRRQGMVAVEQRSS